MNKNLIFIVAYNHETSLASVIGRIPTAILEDPSNEVLVIDDGSRDRTFFVGNELSEKLAPKARLTVLKNPVNQGYGGNQKLGYRYAIDQGFERVILVHGDGQYAPEILGDFIRQYESAEKPDAVFGTRVSEWRSALKGGMPVYKLVGNRILTWLQNRLLSAGMSEFHSGYRSYSTALLRRIPFERNSGDFHFDTEIIIQTLAAGGKIVEIPIPTHYGDEICHVNGFQYAWNVLLASTHYKLQKMGFLYDRRFDVPMAYTYTWKDSPYSSHSRLVEKVPAGSRVLDIGCGQGALAQRLVAKGCTVHGVDVVEADQVGPSVQRYWRIDLNREREKLAGVLATNVYDVIVLGDVIEHLNDPEEFLDLVRANASNPIRVVVSTGNVAFIVVRFMLMLGQFNYGPKGILDRTHTRLFTRASIRRILEQSGYRVEGFQVAPLPFSVVFPGAPRFAHVLEKLSFGLARLRHGLFAFQLIYEAWPSPTARHLLAASNRHSELLRAGGPALTPAAPSRDTGEGRSEHPTEKYQPQGSA
ncbi:methyltransferase domain-containing protein [bacterium]|nr:methyltransferase domain-containing protein [bacterium]